MDLSTTLIIPFGVVIHTLRTGKLAARLAAPLAPASPPALALNVIPASAFN